MPSCLVLSPSGAGLKAQRGCSVQDRDQSKRAPQVPDCTLSWPSLSLQAYKFHYSSSECLDNEYFIHLQTLSPLGSWNNVVLQPRSRGQSLGCPQTPPLPNLCLCTPQLLSSQAFWLWRHCGQWCRHDLGAYLPSSLASSGHWFRLSWQALLGPTPFPLSSGPARAAGRSPWC